MSTSIDHETYRWTCACCGEEMVGLPMAMGFAGPDNWIGLTEEVRRDAFIDSDFCLVPREGGTLERYIRCVLPLPLAGAEDAFHLVVWMSVSEASWHVYRKGYETGAYDTEGCFGFLGNEVSGFPGSYMLYADVWFEPDSMRPYVELHKAEHPLVAAQQDGLQMAQIESWASMMHRG